MLDPLVPGAPVLVAGARVTGRAVLAALTRFGAIPTMCDDDPAMLRPFAESGVATVDPSVAVQQLAQPEPSSESRYALVVTSPGFQPSTPVLAAAAAAGVPIWGDVELAWRLDAAGCYGPPRRWLVVTGTNGKTTTTSMLHAMLVAGQHRSVLCGNIGSPVLDVLEEPADLLAVELSSFQLRWAPSLRPEAGVVLNIAEDHLDWHGTMAAYTEAKARVLTGRVAVVGLDDSRAAALRDTAPAPVRVGFRIGTPAVGELGLRDGHLVDRAFSDDLVLLPASSIPVPGPVGVLDTLAAAALARAVGCRPMRSPTRSPRFRLAGTAAKLWRSLTASPTSTTPRPPTRTLPRHRYWPIHGWCGWLADCSRAHPWTRRWPGWRRGWSGRCSSAKIAQRLPRRYHDTRPMSPLSRL
ncbi:UDP-N-acetylmuramoylalanine--D-glutamate ligase [Mycobacterium ulcerans str. Harvey]|uniref:UDP-N-acetylmuramoylalanine--D-glutamate ligase n=1 Tax=Mycobacterium ulcerans str. Harvey TaxID=1299332 RepID=A0ABP3ABD7_MYCUL|nr:UDP-N-acetylmuramoylalanine--D-glutamate ligase [Mycobacterium ulcerans str. Harvey]